MKTTGKRLEALEQAAQAERARIEALQLRQVKHAIEALSDDDRNNLQDWYRSYEDNIEEVRRIRASVHGICKPLDAVMAERLSGWLDELDTVTGLLPHPPEGVIPYLRLEANDWRRAEHEEASGTPEMQRAARWNAAEFMYYATLAEAVNRWPR